MRGLAPKAACRGAVGAINNLMILSRLTDPVYRRRALEFAADALLCAAAFALAFKLRFLDERMPERYETMLVGSIAFVAVGKAAVLEVLGMHQQWWRYFRLPDLWPLFRSLAIASA